MPILPKTSRHRPWNTERKAFGRMRTDNSAFYHSKEWVALRDAYRTANPLCINVDVCGGATNTIDHIKPISEGGAPLDWSNLQPLCRGCNASKTGKQAWKRIQ